jgi:hypothetical protein
LSSFSQNWINDRIARYKQLPSYSSYEKKKFSFFSMISSKKLYFYP